MSKTKLFTIIGLIVLLSINVTLGGLLIYSLKANQDVLKIVSGNNEAIMGALKTHTDARLNQIDRDIKQITSGVDVINQAVKQIGEKTNTLFQDVILHRDAIGNLKLALDTIKGAFHVIDILRVEVTGYTESAKSTIISDSDTSLHNIKLKPGVIAVSHDLYKKGWTMGKKVYIESLGLFTIGDLMDIKWESKIDIFFNNKKEAFAFGKRNLTIALVSI